MSRISIRRTHRLNHDRALAVAKKVTAELGVSYGIVSAWNGNSARIRGSGITGELIVEPKRFDIDLKLGLLMMMFRDKIEAGIEAKLDELLTAKSKQSGKPASKKG
jgi:putative polyhydroxyalkanoate system protein